MKKRQWVKGAGLQRHIFKKAKTIISQNLFVVTPSIRRTPKNKETMEFKRIRFAKTSLQEYHVDYSAKLNQYYPLDLKNA